MKGDHAWLLLEGNGDSLLVMSHIWICAGRINIKTSFRWGPT